MRRYLLKGNGNEAGMASKYEGNELCSQWCHDLAQHKPDDWFSEVLIHLVTSPGSHIIVVPC